ncbi:hypothetical protein CRENBAI_002650 [Crenichthys baileyi]|uniref:Uncharacterized protein n=1 Tax=Crenichthys baileyi TaxID=28760 RepID=A0AAV9QUI9_9TELE
MFTTSRRRYDASAQVIEGLCEAAAPAHGTEGLGDTSAPAHGTEGLSNASIAVHATAASVSTVGQPDAKERMEDTQPPVHCSKAFQGFKKRLVLVLTSESSDKEFEDKPPDPVLE